MTLQRIKEIPLLDIAGRLGLTLKAGKNPCFRGHGTKTHCLSVTPEKGLFHCFSCGIGGTGIDLVMYYLGLDTAGAIRWLKDQYGISQSAESAKKAFTGTFPAGGYRDTDGSKKIENRASVACIEAFKRDGRDYAEVYRVFLDLLPRQEAVDYLRGRGLSPDIITKSGIRSIPKNFDYTPLKDKCGIDTLVKSGLYSISKRGTPYPTFFAHRLVIPYYDEDGKTILLLQGRNIDDKKDPKYKFLPGIKTVVYNLKEIASAEQGGGKVYITEGVIDCLSCYMLGMTYPIHPIAIGGATNKAIFEPEIFGRLGRLEVVIATDRDKAGQSFYLYFLKRYKASFFKLPKVIDWDRVRDAKDINDLVAPTHRKRYRSALLGETYTVEAGGVWFESGVYYAPSEIEMVKEVDDSEKEILHLLKKAFQGTILV